MTDKIQALYYIKDLRDDNIIYVGKTRDFERRKNQHFGNKKKQPIDLYMFEQGRYNFEMLPFTDDDYSIKTDEELVKAEDKKILELQPLMNIRRSGLIVNKDPKKYHREYSNQYYKNSVDVFYRGAEEVRARLFLLTIELIKEDLPTLDFPARTISGVLPFGY